MLFICPGFVYDIQREKERGFAMVTVIFPAAGQGRRMQAGMNKVFLELSGKPILVRTLLKFSASPSVDRLIVVVGADEVSMIESVLAKVPKLKPWKVTAGGSERQYSVQNGLGCIEPSSDIVLVHDAARPLVSQETIERVIAEAREHGAAIAAVREKNTVKVVGDDLLVKRTPSRAGLWEVQTPQGFQRDILVEAYQKAMQDDFLGTDDASLVERLGIPVRVVESDYRNIKVTTPEDLLVAGALLRETDFLEVKDDVKDALKDAAAEIKERFFRR